jgi:hypothetical protein
VTPRAWTSLSIRLGVDTDQVAGGHHRRQGGLGPLAALQQPIREVRARAQLRDRHVHAAGPGVEVTMPVPVAGVDSLRAGHPVRGTETASASADISVLMNVDNICRNRSGDAWSSCSCRNHSGSNTGRGGHRVGLLQESVRGL